jgi:peptide deformylase
MNDGNDDVTVLEIIEIGHPTLRQRATQMPVEDIKSAEVQQFIDDLIATKRHASGAGIAANQVDDTRRIFIAEAEHNSRFPFRPEYPLTVLINPVVTFLTDERFGNFEGCLSIPNLRGVVPRCPHIRVQGFDREAKAVDFEVSGICAGIFQHEADHLDGVMFTDLIADPTTLCTATEFERRCVDQFRQRIIEVEAAWGGMSGK